MADRPPQAVLIPNKTETDLVPASDREQASQELSKLGKSALPSLKQAANRPDAEVRSRAHRLLERRERFDLFPVELITDTLNRQNSPHSPASSEPPECPVGRDA
jgi:hypothetical protein